MAASDSAEKTTNQSISSRSAASGAARMRGASPASCLSSPACMPSMPVDAALDEAEVLLGDDHGAVADVDRASAPRRRSWRSSARGRATARRPGRRVGSPMKARPSETMRRSPPDSVPTRLVEQLRERREDLEDAVAALLALAPGLAAEGAGVEVLAHRQSPGKMCVALRRQRDAAADDRRRAAAGAVRAAPADLVAVELDRAGLPAGQADDRLQQGRLAVAVEADEADALAPTRRSGRGRAARAAARSRRTARGSRAAASRGGGLRPGLEVGGADHRLVEDGLRRALRR